jgi:MraZ protein
VDKSELQRTAAGRLHPNFNNFTSHLSFLLPSWEKVVDSSSTRGTDATSGSKFRESTGNTIREQVHVQNAILLGEHDLTFDEKNRILVPSDIRRVLDAERDGDHYVLVIGENRRPWLYPSKVYERLVAELQQELTPDEDQLAFDQMFFSMSSRIEVDKQGRILLPEKILKRTGVGKEVTMLGARNHLEIWNRADWEIEQEQLFANRKEITARFKQKRSPASGNQGL